MPAQSGEFRMWKRDQMADRMSKETSHTRAEMPVAGRAAPFVALPLRWTAMVEECGATSVECRLLPIEEPETQTLDQEGQWASLIEQTDVEIGELVLGKRKKDVEEEDELDD